MTTDFNRRLAHIILSVLIVPLLLHAAERKPNVLFIIADDLRPDLGCYGAKHIQSPNIDRLAARGMVFERAYCQQAVCNPSRASVLSGCRPDTTRVMANNTFLRPMMPDVVTLPQHFKNNGWHTLSLGKMFHHSEKEPGDDPQSWSEPSWYHGEPYRQLVLEGVGRVHQAAEEAAGEGAAETHPRPALRGRERAR